MVDLSDIPVRLRCTRCYEERAVFARIDPEYGDYGSVVGGEPVYRLDPPCPGYYDPEEPPGGYTSAGPQPLTEDTDTVQRVWCPFDGRDDYQTGDEDAVWVARRHAREVLEARDAD